MSVVTPPWQRQAAETTAEDSETTIAASDAFDSDHDALPAHPASPLAGLRRQREKARAASFLDVKVPGLTNPQWCVRFRAATPAEVTRFNARVEKVRAEEKLLRMNAAMIATCCLGIFTLDDNDEPVGDPRDWPRFDDTLATALGISLDGVTDRAQAVVREFYVEEADIVAVGDRLSGWSIKTDQNLIRSAPED